MKLGGNVRTHPKFGGQNHRGTIVRFCHRHVWTGGMGGNLSK